jgi:predicted amidophosphoribosyltransferase
MPRQRRQFRLCSRCGEDLNDGPTRWRLCYSCELELEALSSGVDPEEIDTTDWEIRRAISVLNFRGQFLNYVDDPDDSSTDPT